MIFLTTQFREYVSHQHTRVSPTIPLVLMPIRWGVQWPLTIFLEL